MCGIAGYVGKQNSVSVLLSCLKRLEYRGYDSSGIAFINQNEIKVIKAKGSLENLENKLNKISFSSTIGLGHTRWATHGKANEQNAHPHLSSQKKVCVVHNGIIENFLELKKGLNDVKFLSETDTEVFANLLEKNLENVKTLDQTLLVLKETTKKLKGSYAFGIILSNFPDKLFFAKKESPLILGVSKDFNMISSDVVALLDYTKHVVYLKDGDIGYISQNDFKIFKDGSEVKRKIITLNSFQERIDKGKYSSFMEKEIQEGAMAVVNTMLHLLNTNDKKLKELIYNTNSIYVVACGTALHAGEVFKHVLEKELRIKVCVDFASEFRYKKPIIDEKSLCIFISQSGETADTIASAVLAKEKKAKTIAITNTHNSKITQICDVVLKTYAGIEIAVASTKAYLAQLSALYYLVLVFAKQHNKKVGFSGLDIINLAKRLEQKTYKNEIEKIAKDLSQEQSLFFVGRGIDYLLSKEGALKLKEISYIHCEAFAGGELKHGSLSLIDQTSFVVCVLTQKNLIDKMLSNIIEMQSRGAKIVLLSCFDFLKDKVFYFIKVPEEKSLLMPFVAIRPLTELALFCSKQKGLNPDKPRNLAKSVTVEWYKNWKMT